MVAVRRLNHAVLGVEDLDRSVQFYTSLLGFEMVVNDPDHAVFLRLPSSENHHDLALCVPEQRPDITASQPAATGLHHLAWEVDTVEDLREAHRALVAAGAFVGGADHGATKSIYGVDPDGHEFEIMWLVSRDQWGVYDHAVTTAPLNLTREVAEHGNATGP